MTDGKKTTPQNRPRYVLCIRNDGYPASLEKRKTYEALPDPDAKARRQMRVVDESGEDYLYPADYFVPVNLPKEAEQALAETGRP